MRLAILLLFSAALFAVVRHFCRRNGLFDAGSMGMGQIFALALFGLLWVLPTLVALIYLAVA